jgi:hypothetical protein
MAKASAAVARGKRRGSTLWMQGLACGALVTLATPTAVLAGVLLVPTFVVAAIDRADGKPVARAVLLYGLAGLALPLVGLWTGGHSMDQSIGLVTDPAVVAIAWAAQAAGWLTAELAPLAVRLLLDLKTAAHMAKLRNERAALAADWGTDDK